MATQGQCLFIHPSDILDHLIESEEGGELYFRLSAGAKAKFNLTKRVGCTLEGTSRRPIRLHTKYANQSIAELFPLEQINIMPERMTGEASHSREVIRPALLSAKSLNYLQSRGINPATLERFQGHLLLLETERYGRTYLVWQMHNGDVTLRAADALPTYKKLYLTGHSPTFSLCELNPATATVVITEGLCSALSYYQLTPEHQPCDYLILNSVTNTQRAIDYLKTARYGELIIALDSDGAGIEASGVIASQLHDRSLRLAYPYYPLINGKDWNDRLLDCP